MPQRTVRNLSAKPARGKDAKRRVPRAPGKRPLRRSKKKKKDQSFERGAKAIMEKARRTGQPYFPFGEPVYDE